MSIPKVSILIPTYNQPQFIKKAIESALMQDYQNLEVIVSDDSTNEETELIVKQYENDIRFTYYRNIPSLGRTGNYRKLLYGYAAGEWAVNLDGDDYYTDRLFVAQGMNEIMKTGSSEVLFYMSSQIKVAADYELPFIPKLDDDETIMSAWDYYYNIYSFLHFSHLSTLYNAALAKDSGFYKKNISSSDMNSIFRLCLRHRDKKVILSKRIAGNWVQHGGNESSNLTFKQQIGNGNYYFGIFTFAAKNNFGNIYKNLFWLLKSLFFYWGSYIKRLFMPGK